MAQQIIPPPAPARKKFKSNNPRAGESRLYECQLHSYARTRQFYLEEKEEKNDHYS